MNGPHETLPDGVPVSEQLAAYLDGELDSESRQQVEQQLSQSDELRHRVKEYQQAWDLLDDLPRATVDGSFTRTTVEMVAIQAESEVKQARQFHGRRRMLVWCVGAVGVVAASTAGFLLNQQRLAAPNEQIVEELPIIRHLDAYQNAGSIEFLKQLDAQKIFQETGDGI